MITVEEHLATVLGLLEPLSPVQRSGRSALGLVLADDLKARLAVPPFDNSAMDGYAVRAVDVAGATAEQPVTLAVQGDLPAGAAPAQALRADHAFRIMTGAPMPHGADAIIPVEATDQPRGSAPLPAQVQVFAPSPAGKHLRRTGEDCRPGDSVAVAGDLVTPALLSSAASTGWGTLTCTPRPRVWVLSSGSELVPAGQPLAPGQIPDSNSLLLSGLVEQFGGEVVAVDVVNDDPEALRRRFADALDVDLVVTTGGVSAGAFEVVRDVTEGAVQFVQVAMQPGKPQGVGRVLLGNREVPMLALPGNPVSVFVSAWLFVRAALRRLAGLDPTLATVELPAGDAWTTPPGRRQYLPGRLASGAVRQVHRLGSGSHLVAALHRAEVLAVVDADVDQVTPGQLVQVIRLDQECS